MYGKQYLVDIYVMLDIYSVFNFAYLGGGKI